MLVAVPGHIITVPRSMIVIGTVVVVVVVGVPVVVAVVVIMVVVVPVFVTGCTHGGFVPLCVGDNKGPTGAQNWIRRVSVIFSILHPAPIARQGDIPSAL